MVVIINRRIQVPLLESNIAKVAITDGHVALVVLEPAKVQNLAKGIFSGLQTPEKKLQQANRIDGHYIFRVEGMGAAIGGERGLRIPVIG